MLSMEIITYQLIATWICMKGFTLWIMWVLLKADEPCFLFLLLMEKIMISLRGNRYIWVDYPKEILSKIQNLHMKNSVAEDNLLIRFFFRPFRIESWYGIYIMTISTFTLLAITYFCVHEDSNSLKIIGKKTYLYWIMHPTTYLGVLSKRDEEF